MRLSLSDSRRKNLKLKLHSLHKRQLKTYNFDFTSAVRPAPAELAACSKGVAYLRISKAAFAEWHPKVPPAPERWIRPAVGTTGGVRTGTTMGNDHRIICMAVDMHQALQTSVDIWWVSYMTRSCYLLGLRRSFRSWCPVGRLPLIPIYGYPGGVAVCFYTRQLLDRRIALDD